MGIALIEIRSSNILGMARRFLRHSYPFQANLCSLSSVVGLGHLLEPCMVQGLLSSDALGRIVDENLLE